MKLKAVKRKGDYRGTSFENCGTAHIANHEHGVSSCEVLIRKQKVQTRYAFKAFIILNILPSKITCIFFLQFQDDAVYLIFLNDIVFGIN